MRMTIGFSMFLVIVWTAHASTAAGILKTGNHTGIETKSRRISGLSDTSFITLEEFGVKGDGTNETTAILKAIQFAREKKKGIRFAKKTYLFSPLHTVDITGIPFFEGEGTIDLSKTGAAAGNPSMKVVFHLSGKKLLLQSGITSLKQGNGSVKIRPGLKLKQNDILFLTSAELLSNVKRPYYCKGQRLTVTSYNASTGILVLADTLWYDMDVACLWLNSERPSFSVSSSMKFITSPMNFITCFRIYYAHANISGFYKNFALTAIMYKSSDGRVEKMQGELPVNENNGYSHFVEVADMSLVTIKDCELSGGRHTISGTAGGLWEKEECGGKGHAGYPSELTIIGGTHRGSIRNPAISQDIGTLDAHGVVHKMTIKNCTVYGGINLGANFMTVEKVTIYTEDKNAFNVGSDVSSGAQWGNYFLKDIKIICSRDQKEPIFFSKADVPVINIENVTIQNLPADCWLMDFNYNSPQKVTVEGLRGQNLSQGHRIRSLKRTEFVFRNSDINEYSVKKR